MAKEASPYLLAVVATLGSELAAAGFVSAKNRKSDGKHRWDRWVRDAGWKHDVVEVSSVTRVGWSLIPHVSVELPHAAGGLGLLDGSTVGAVVGRPSTYRYPLFYTFFAARRGPRFGRRVARDVVTALRFFDDYPTPAQALERLQADETVWCDARGQRYLVLRAALEAAIR